MNIEDYHALILEEFPNMEIQYRAGKGAKGEVYCAKQTTLNRLVALKILPPEFNVDPQRRKRFLREARALSQLSHPNLVKFYDFGETDDFTWMTLEWVEGKTLLEAEMDGGLAVNDALALVCKVCDALSHAHEHGVVHRDVKPANIFLTGDGEVKLSDFGLARDVQGDANSIISVSGSTIGSAEYAAPEFWKDGVPIDHRADIFSLGVLLYEALTGQRPSGIFRMPSQLNSDLDPRIDGVIVNAMQEMPEQRYQSCDEFMAAIKEVMEVPYQHTSLHLNTARVTATPMLNTGPITETAPIQANRVSATTPIATRVMQPASSGSGGGSGIAGKLVLILGLAGLLLGARYMMREKLEKVDQQQAQADARLEKELASREEIKRKIEADKRARESVTIANSDEAEDEVMAESTAALSTASDEKKTEEKPEITTERAPVVISPAIEELDKKIISQARGVIASFNEKQEKMGEKYMQACKKEEDNAVQRGDLDQVLFWQDEIKSVTEHGEPEQVTEGIPSKAEKLRSIWHSEMKGYHEKIDYLQKSYLDTCKKISERYIKDGEKELADLADYRAVKLADREEFLRLCNGEEISYGKMLPLNSELPKLGAKLINSDNIGCLFDSVSDNNGKAHRIDVLDHFTLDLADIYYIKKMRFKLYDLDPRYFFYILMGSADGETWTVISDRSARDARGWQEIDINHSYRFLRFKDTGGVVANGDITKFHLLEMELISK